MPMSTYRPENTEVPIGSGLANNVNGAPLVRVLNPAAVANSLHFLYANGVEYANLTVLPTSDVIVKKWNTTDLLQGNNMVAVNVAYEY